MASFLFTNYKKAALSGDVRPLSDTIKVMLMNATYAGAINTAASETAHRVTGDISSYEITAGSNPGYTKGGITLTSKAVTADNTDKEGVFDAADISWTSSTITASGAIIYREGTGEAGTIHGPQAAANSILIAFVDFGQNQSSTNGTFQISWNAEGIINWT